MKIQRHRKQGAVHKWRRKLGGEGGPGGWRCLLENWRRGGAFDETLFNTEYGLIWFPGEGDFRHQRGMFILWVLTKNNSAILRLGDRERWGSNYLEMIGRQGERGVKYLENFDDFIYGQPPSWAGSGNCWKRLNCCKNGWAVKIQNSHICWSSPMLQARTLLACWWS